jgi:hypothetical protein
MAFSLQQAMDEFFNNSGGGGIQYGGTNLVQGPIAGGTRSEPKAPASSGHTSPPGSTIHNPLPPSETYRHDIDFIRGSSAGSTVHYANGDYGFLGGERGWIYAHEVCADGYPANGVYLKKIGGRSVAEWHELPFSCP